MGKASDSKISDGRANDGGTNNSKVDNSRVDNSGVGDGKKSKIDILEKNSLLELIWISVLANFLIVSSQLGIGKFLAYNKLSSGVI